jgi:hypothetical protein
MVQIPEAGHVIPNVPDDVVYPDPPNHTAHTAALGDRVEE